MAGQRGGPCHSSVAESPSSDPTSDASSLCLCLACIFFAQSILSTQPPEHCAHPKATCLYTAGCATRLALVMHPVATSWHPDLHPHHATRRSTTEERLSVASRDYVLASTTKQPADQCPE